MWEIDGRGCLHTGGWRYVHVIAPPPTKVRALVHTNDNNHDDAVADLRAATELLHGGERRQALEAKLREAQFAQRNWNNQRDHRLVLKLPINLRELSADEQCTWVKRQYKMLAKKWHPDKAKGDKDRAVRKMRETSDAKEHLSKELGCRGR